MTNQYSAAHMAAVQEMAHLARMIEPSEDSAIIGQAARVFNAIRAMPDADFAAQSYLATVKCQAQIIATMRGELAAKEAECAELASRINAPVAGSVGDDPKFKVLLALYRACVSFTQQERFDNLVAYLDSRPASAPSVDRNATPVAWAVYTENGNVRIWFNEPEPAINWARINNAQLTPFYTAPVAQPLAASSLPVMIDACTSNELLVELRRWAGADKGYAACMIRAAANEIERLTAAPRQEAQPAVQVVTEREKSLYSALNAVMSWIHNWSPDFIFDPEWPADRNAAFDALTAPSQQPAASEVTK